MQLPPSVVQSPWTIPPRLLGAEMCLQNARVEARTLILHASEYDCIWRWGL